MDIDALAQRNRQLAARQHEESAVHRLRRIAISTAGRLPIPASSSSAAVSRVLIIRPDHIGDVLLTTPALHALRAWLPDAVLDVMSGPWSADALSGNTDIDHVLTYAFPAFNRAAKQSVVAPYMLAIEAARMLRKACYSACVVLRPDDWWSALVCKLAGIPRRIGCDVPSVRTFLTHAETVQHEHSVLTNLRLCAVLADRDASSITRASLRFTITDEARREANDLLNAAGIHKDNRVVVIHPGAGAFAKLWEDGQWSAVADELAREVDAAVVITGSQGEWDLAQRVVQSMTSPAVNLAGHTRLPVLGALYARALLVAGPDSGPLHLACAVGTPTVALFGPADPDEFGPWGDPERHRVLTTEIACRPCRILSWPVDDLHNHPCVRMIPVEAVLKAAREAINVGKTPI